LLAGTRHPPPAYFPDPLGLCYPRSKFRMRGKFFFTFLGYHPFGGSTRFGSRGAPPSRLNPAGPRFSPPLFRCCFMGSFLYPVSPPLNSRICSSLPCPSQIPPPCEGLPSLFFPRPGCGPRLHPIHFCVFFTYLLRFFPST